MQGDMTWLLFWKYNKQSLDQYHNRRTIDRLVFIVVVNETSHRALYFVQGRSTRRARSPRRYQHDDKMSRPREQRCRPDGVISWNGQIIINRREVMSISPNELRGAMSCPRQNPVAIGAVEVHRPRVRVPEIGSTYLIGCRLPGMAS